VNGLSFAQALPDQINVSLRGSNPARGFLLERVEDVQDALKTRCVDGPVGIPVEVVANL
jgi:hypothetical protein